MRRTKRSVAYRSRSSLYSFQQSPGCQRAIHFLNNNILYKQYFFSALRCFGLPPILYMHYLDTVFHIRHRGVMEDIWEWFFYNYGRGMGTYGQSMRQTWERYGKSMGEVSILEKYDRYRGSMKEVSAKCGRRMGRV